MTKVLHIDLGRQMRGGQWQVFYLARFQRQEGRYTPVVACPKASPLAGKLREIDVEVVELASMPHWNPFSFIKLLCAWRKHKFSIVHTHDAKAAACGAMFKRFLGKKICLVHTRRVSYPVKKASISKYKAADAVVAVSQDTANSLRNSGIPAAQLCVIHSGIDLARYVPRIPQDRERFIFLVVGALTPQKGHTVLIKAMKHLMETEDMPPWEVRAIGDGPLFNSILAEAKALKVDSRLSLLGRQDASKIMPFCDVMVVPSVDGEGSSGTVKEAWAVGLPLICSSLAANLELVNNERNGLVFTSGQDEALADAMRRLALDPALCASLAESGRESVQQYTADKMASSYTRLYNRILHF